MMHQDYVLGRYPKTAKTISKNVQNTWPTIKTIFVMVTLLLIFGTVLYFQQEFWIAKCMIVCILPISALFVFWACQSDETKCTSLQLVLSFAKGLALSFAYILIFTGIQIFAHEGEKNLFDVYLSNIGQVSTQYLLFALLEEGIKVILCRTIYYSPTNISSVHFRMLAFSCGTAWFDALMIYRRQQIPTIFLCEATFSFCVATISSYFHAIIHKEKDYIVAITILLFPLRLIFVGFRLCSMWGGYKCQAIFQICSLLSFYAVFPSFGSGYTNIFNIIDYKKND